MTESRVKKAAYLSASVLLGLLLQLIVHAVVEIIVIGRLVSDFEKYGLGMTWADWYAIHFIASVVLVIVGAAFGLWIGRRWWTMVYVERRHPRIRRLDEKRLLAARRIDKAGAIILSSADDGKIILIHRGDRDDWSFPKGHAEPGETMEQTMLREVKEETGLDVTILGALPNMEYDYPEGGHIIVSMFLVRSEDDGKMRTEHDNDRLEAVAAEDAVKKLSYGNLQDYLNRQLPTILGRIKS